MVDFEEHFGVKNVLFIKPFIAVTGSVAHSVIKTTVMIITVHSYSFFQKVIYQETIVCSPQTKLLKYSFYHIK